jgi:hypothetical protein
MSRGVLPTARFEDVRYRFRRAKAFRLASSYYHERLSSRVCAIRVLPHTIMPAGPGCK